MDTLTANDFLVRGLCISTATQQQDACWAWLKYLSTAAAAACTADHSRMPEGRRI